MLNFSQEQEQRDSRSIPPNSMVLVQIELKQPTANNQISTASPFITVSQQGYSRVVMNLNVVGGQFKGTSIKEGCHIPEHMQPVQNMPQNQKTACEIGGRFLRAILDSSRRLDPSDYSEQADQQRHVNGWEDFNGLMVPIRVGYDKNGYMQAGKVLTIKDPEFEQLMAGQDIITDDPIPERQTTQQQAPQQELQQQGAYSPPPPAQQQPMQQQPMQHQQQVPPQQVQHQQQQPPQQQPAQQGAQPQQGLQPQGASWYNS